MANEADQMGDHACACCMNTECASTAGKHSRISCMNLVKSSNSIFPVTAPACAAFGGVIIPFSDMGSNAKTN